MAKGTLTVSRTGPGVDAIVSRTKALSASQVLVGIPQQKSSRRSGEVNNAELIYIHTNGSPLRNIPKRPVIEPAIMAEDNKARIMTQLEAAAQAELAGDHDLAIEHLNRAGMIGSTAAKRWFTDPRNGWPPNKRATILRKLRKLQGKRKTAALAALNAGNLDAVDTPLIDTGQLRRAITFVVEDAGPQGNQESEQREGKDRKLMEDSGQEGEAAEVEEIIAENPEILAL